MNKPVRDTIIAIGLAVLASIAYIGIIALAYILFCPYYN